MEKQIGGWYLNPATGKTQRWWGDAGWTDGSDPTQNNNAATAGKISDSYYSDLTGAVNKYTDDLIAESKGQRDLMAKKLDAEHKLALGNDDVEKAKFLETVADQLEQKIGRIPYDYQRYTQRELDTYALDKNDIATSKKLALERLANDEKSLSGEQTSANKSKLEDLNARGLIEGQKPLTSTEPGPSPITGLKGIAGAQVAPQNTSFDTSFGNLGIQKEGIINDANSANARRDLAHTNTLQDIQTDARRGAQNAENANTFGQASNDLNYNEQLKALERKRDELLRKSREQATTLGGKQAGILGY